MQSDDAEESNDGEIQSDGKGYSMTKQKTTSAAKTSIDETEVEIDGSKKLGDKSSLLSNAQSKGVQCR